MVHPLGVASGNVDSEHELPAQGSPKRPRIDRDTAQRAEDDSDDDDPDLFASDDDDDEEESKKSSAVNDRNEAGIQQPPPVNGGQGAATENGTNGVQENEVSLPLLHALIYDMNWERVIERVQELRQNNNGVGIPELHAKPFALPFTPLQLACQYNILEGRATDGTDREQWAACVKTILDGAPDAVLEKTSDDGKTTHGDSVFHIILQEKPPLDLVEYMVQVWAEQKGVDVADAWNEILRDRGRDEMLPIHYAIQHRASSDVVLKLLEEYPNSAVEMHSPKPPKVPQSTIDQAVYFGCSLRVLEALLEQGTGAISRNTGPRKPTKSRRQTKRRAKLKDTPLHLLFHPEKQHRWIRGQAPSGIMSPYKMAWYLIQKHAHHFKEQLGAKSKGDPTARARHLIFHTQGDGNQTIMDRAKMLEKRISENHDRRDYAELIRIQEDFARIKQGYEFPKIDFTDD